MIRNTTTAWGLVSRAFHWILGLAIIGMIAYGYWLNHWAARPDRFFHRSIHADIGYLILLLMAAAADLARDQSHARVAGGYPAMGAGAGPS